MFSSSKMKQLNVSLLLVLVTCCPISFSYPNGAPISTCETMKPGHVGVYPQPKPAPYIMKINSSSYQSGKPIQVQILGPPYRGILLQTRTFAKTTLYGTWLEPPKDTKILPCPGNTVGSITHANTNLKNQSTTYIWMPPNSSCPYVLFFVATVAESFNVYWLGVRSAIIYRDPTTTCSMDKNTGKSGLFLDSSGMAWEPALYLFMCLQLVLFLVEWPLLL
ncbi:putative defense protein 3 [Bufo gargarizans]|uniref:putative defense protein 3 n=1 Tax=Bufo gargarizans TaxID=30331 RepID=UPI001CF0F72F|nr:putative defense protein 3 [Bufo gargarizans]